MLARNGDGAESKFSPNEGEPGGFAQFRLLAQKRLVTYKNIDAARRVF
jgi:hypothetical protein